MLSLTIASISCVSITSNNSFQHTEVNPLILQGEFQMSLECLLRLMPGGKEMPLFPPYDFMFQSCSHFYTGEGCRKLEGIDESGVPGWNPFFRAHVAVKNCYKT